MVCMICHRLIAGCWWRDVPLQKPDRLWHDTKACGVNIHAGVQKHYGQCGVLVGRRSGTGVWGEECLGLLG